MCGSAPAGHPATGRAVRRPRGSGRPYGVRRGPGSRTPCEACDDRPMIVAQKLQLKPGQVVLVLGAPPDAALDVPRREGDGDEADAVLLFVRTRAELDERAGPVVG